MTGKWDGKLVNHPSLMSQFDTVVLLKHVNSSLFDHVDKSSSKLKIGIFYKKSSKKSKGQKRLMTELNKYKTFWQRPWY